MFHDYMDQFSASEFRKALIELFQVLDTAPEDRDPYMDEKLAAFPFVSGGMFAGDIEIPRITEEIRTLILQRASDDFDWSLISPTIFGAVFESTLNPATRRAGGMHYTSLENIHKVIDPLFLDDLKAELADIKAEKVVRTKKARAAEFQDKLASLKFLDPACGSGNFLTESYTWLRRLENEAIKILYDDRVIGGLADPVKVSIYQFYGIEINDFACSVSQAALWIAETQMLKETDAIVGYDLEPLPLKDYHNIREANALRTEWSLWEDAGDSTIVYADHTHLYPVDSYPAALEDPAVKYGSVDLYSPDIQIHPVGKNKTYHQVKFDFIMGNPPFLGARIMSPEQKDDLVSVFGPKWKNIGNMDYVTGWYKKAQEMMEVNPHLRAALVSTNSITQGEQVANLWKPLMEAGIHIDFAWRTFIWDSEANQKAHVHCVIVGFSCDSTIRTKIIYDRDKAIEAANINGYLIDGENVYIESRPSVICSVPSIGIGNMPIDGGFYLFKDDEKEEFVAKEPGSEKYFRRWYGSDEFINRRPRWCLWLGGANPMDLIKLPECLKRIESVQEFRASSSRPSTKKLADKPTRFGTENMPNGNYLLIPKVSSERRHYIPVGFMTPEILSSDLVFIIPDATLYHFGVLTSKVHNAWMRVVCGRLKSDFRYSKDIVYNNFPWPEPTEDQKSKIEQTAQAILDARQIYPEASFAD
ncbi:MAG: class I SAM-dependent DNA methyltransferase, partial [Bacteroidales bacterium]|nr:class I SAM-dependent DNA methyltransferase [Bacteroidales bacterium]